MSDQEIDVFRFTALRDAEKLRPSEARKKFIRDDFYICTDRHSDEHVGPSVSAIPGNQFFTGIHDYDLFSNSSFSPIGKAIINGSKSTLSKAQLIDKVEALLVSGFQYLKDSEAKRLPPIIKEFQLDKNITPLQASMAGMLSQKNYYNVGKKIRVLPDQLSDIETPLSDQLNHALGYFNHLQWHQKSLLAPEFNLDTFIDSLSKKIGIATTHLTLTELVFDIANGSYTSGFLMSKRILFDALYGLYVLRKRQKVSLEPAMQGLRALHLLEMMAMCQYLMALERGGDSLINFTNPGKLKIVLGTLYPSLKFWSPDQPDVIEQLIAEGFPFPRSFAELGVLLDAVPVINPVIARISTDLQPFNSLTPIGVGDLKVVKQKFLGYQKGEIAHVETVLAGENKTRVHRALEKSQDSFSFLSSSESENTKDTQSTARYELKNETENVLKENLNVNANLSAGYNYMNGVVVVNASAGMSYTNAKDSTAKSSRNFVDEVLSKATSRIVSRSSNERSRTLLVETEETNTHAFINPATNGNISGIYRWLNKVYQGQIYNYGKRLMFELVVPEPAAFYVQSRLYAYAASLDLPAYEDSSTVNNSSNNHSKPVASAKEITEDVYNALKAKYKISDIPPPALVIENVPVFHGGSSLFGAQHANRAGQIWDGYANGSIRSGIAADYDLVGCRVKGSLDYYNSDRTGGAPINEKNTLEVQLNQTPVFYWMDDTIMGFHDYDCTYDLRQPQAALESFRVDIGTQTNKTYSLSIFLKYAIKPAVYAAWQERVFAQLTADNKIPDQTTNSQPLPNAKLQAYEDALSKISAPQLNDIIAGRSPADNELIIRKEIKRECISMITKEFDSNTADDEFSRKNAMGKLAVPNSIFFPNFNIHRFDDTDKNPATYGRFTDKNEGTQHYDVPNINVALEKGRFIQFIEQAFEWEHISQIFYPYFWADIPKWVELMNREDLSDPIFTNFLQAGSARVLLAVRPGYESAVAHFLATREIWVGGPSPVIGDSLYVPLYDEIRSQQDSLSGAEPDGDPWIFELPTSLVYLESNNPEYKLVNEYISSVT